MNKNTFFIAFSGGCLSGKTTTIKEVKKIYDRLGLKTVVLDELMRSHTLESIDDLRSRPDEYFELEKTIISEKIATEMNLFNNNEKCVILCDRAITDSLFYLLFYAEKNKFSVEQLREFNELYCKIDKYAKYAFENIYDVLVEFKPLELSSNDKYRPNNIDVLKHMEYRFIHTLNEAYGQYTSKLEVDLNPILLHKDEVSFTEDVEKIFNPIARNIFKKWRIE